MTMPETVWINDGNNQQTWLHICNKYHTQRMIRAEVAEQLALALEQVEEVMLMLDGKHVSKMTDAERAVMMLDRSPLARYRALTT